MFVLFHSNFELFNAKARIAVFRFFENVDHSSEIKLLDEDVSSTREFLEKFDKIPYNGYGKCL